MINYLLKNWTSVYFYIIYYSLPARIPRFLQYSIFSHILYETPMNSMELFIRNICSVKLNEFY